MDQEKKNCFECRPDLQIVGGFSIFFVLGLFAALVIYRHWVPAGLLAALMVVIWRMIPVSHKLYRKIVVEENTVYVHSWLSGVAQCDVRDIGLVETKTSIGWLSSKVVLHLKAHNVFGAYSVVMISKGASHALVAYLRSRGVPVRNGGPQ